MCLQTWTFKPRNVNQIRCSDCILRWTWDAHHLGPQNAEKCNYFISLNIPCRANEALTRSTDENCADVRIERGGNNGGNNNSNNNPASTEDSQSDTTESKPDQKKQDSGNQEEGKDSSSSAKGDSSNDKKGENTGIKDENQDSSGSESANKEVSGSVNCQCDSSTSTPYFECAKSSSSNEYCVCFPGGTTTIMRCAAGTKCSQKDKEISCA
jgi:hypothetical protein